MKARSVFLILIFAPLLSRSQPFFNAKLMDAMVQFNAEKKTDRLLISIRDTLVLDKTYRGKPDQLFYVYSITKLLSGIAVGMLIDQQYITDPELPIADFFPEWKNDSLKSRVTIRHVLQHTSGLFCYPGSRDIYPQPDFVAYALNSPMAGRPGEKYIYNNRAMNIISGLVRKRTGQSLESFFKENLFSPLDITRYSWKTDQQGNTWAMDGLSISGSDLLKIGQMICNGGVWRGRRILSASWCRLMGQLPLVNAMNATGGYGLSIRALYRDEKIRILPETIRVLHEKGLESTMVHRFEGLMDSSYHSWLELGSILKQRFSIAEMERITALAYRSMLPLYEVANQNTILMHGGEYRLMVAVMPKTRTVLVRFLGEKHGRELNKEGTYRNQIDGELLVFMFRLSEPDLSER